MPPETGLNGSPRESKDLDSVVSSFLAELEVLSNELQTPPESPASTPLPDFPLAEIAAPEPEIFPEDAIRRELRPSWHHSRHVRILTVSVLAAAILFACWWYIRPSDRTIVKPAVPPSPVPVRTNVPVPGQMHDMALLLAGLPLKPESPLYRLSITDSLQRHQREMQLFWNRIRKGNLLNIRQWREENIPSQLEKNPVLYPLSGADFLNAYSFFPHAREYLLIALEYPGSIPDMGRLDEKEIDNTLSAIRYSVQSLASANYLQSRAMREELTNSSFRGVVPVLLLLAAGFGHTIQSVQPVTISRDGRLILANAGSVPNGFHRVAGINIPDDIVNGIRIQYTDGIDGTTKLITYLQMELKDQLFSGPRPESKFLRELKNQNTILKSAVYLLHGANYGEVSDFIRARSDLILQDDSGIPYNQFPSSVWETHLFGTYTRPEPLGTLTNPPRQPLLAQQYALGSRPLNFPYGYGVLWGKGRSNMMLLVKK